jgi:hypothetical protein
VFRSVDELEAAFIGFVPKNNDQPKSFVWTALEKAKQEHDRRAGTIEAERATSKTVASRRGSLGEAKRETGTALCRADLTWHSSMSVR